MDEDLVLPPAAVAADAAAAPASAALPPAAVVAAPAAAPAGSTPSPPAAIAAKLAVAPAFAGLRDGRVNERTKKRQICQHGCEDCHPWIATKNNTIKTCIPIHLFHSKRVRRKNNCTIITNKNKNQLHKEMAKHILTSTHANIPATSCRCRYSCGYSSCHG
jgi:hypothetical protein